MIATQHIEDLVSEKVKDTILFLVDLRIDVGNKITVEIDGEKGVGIDDCVAISRYIESNLDREKEDFELSVTSAGLGKPLKIKRQFEKNLGKDVQLKNNDGIIIEGVLLGASDDCVTLMLPPSKKKSLPEREAQYGWAEINEVRLKIVFK